MGYTKADNFFFMMYAERMAANAVYQKFRLNRYELTMLCGISTYLQVYGKKAVSIGAIFKWFGFGSRAKVKGGAYMHGLKKHGALHSVNYKPNGKGQSVVISGYGNQILALYWVALEDIDRKHKHRKKQPGYKDIAFDIKDIEQALPKYSLVSEGITV